MPFLRRLATNLRQFKVHAERPLHTLRALTANAGFHHVVVPMRVLETYQEMARSVAEVLRKLHRGATVHFVSRLEQVGPLKTGDRVIVYGVHRFGSFEPRPGVLYVGVNVEQYPPDWTPEGTEDRLVQKADAFLSRCQIIVDCNECLFQESARLGRPAQGILPFGYTERLDSGREHPADPPYDLAFLGRLGDGRRHDAMHKLAREFSVAPVHRAWGRRRFRFLQSAKIQLDLHQHEKPCLAGHRFALALANGSFLLSEPLPPGAPFQAGVHFVEARLPDFPEAIRHYLLHAEERQKIACAGRNFFRHHYRLDDAVRRLLPILDEAAAKRVASVP